MTMMTTLMLREHLRWRSYCPEPLWIDTWHTCSTAADRWIARYPMPEAMVATTMMMTMMQQQLLVVKRQAMTMMRLMLYVQQSPRSPPLASDPPVRL